MKKTKRLITTLIIILAVLTLRHFFTPYQIQQTQPVTHQDIQGDIIIGNKHIIRENSDDVPPDLMTLITQLEDKRIGQHPGIDIIALTNALRSRRRHNSSRGASTIAQQFIKNDRQHTTRSRKNKLTEMRYALSFTAHHRSEDIIRHYLNTVPFAYSVTGRRAACQRYRGRTCDKIGTQKTRILVMMMQRSYNPYRTDHQAKILGRIQMYQRVRPELFASGFTIDETIFDELTDTAPSLDPRVAEILQLTNPADTISYDSELANTIDYLLDKSTTLRQEYDVQHCCVLVINQEGHLRSANMCTPREDPIDGKINACLIPRQTGSSIKPFLYAFAFQKLGFSADDTIVDEPVAYDLGNGSLYTPQNFDLTHHGEVSLAYALGNSLNIPAVKLLDQVGVREFFAFLQDRWTQYIPQVPLNPDTVNNLGLSLALGSYEMSPLVLTQLRRFFTPDNQTAYQSPANEVRAILGDYQHKITSFGQDGLLDTPGRSLKTGTSRHFIDGWICGIHHTSFDTVCIRLGNYDNSRMKGASSEVGSYLWSQVVGNWE